MKTKLVLISQCWLLWNIGAIKFVSVACFLTWLLDLVKFEWFICSSYSFQLAKINTSETRIDTKISLRIRKALLQSWNLTQFYFLHFLFSTFYFLQDEQCDTPQKMTFSVMDIFNKCDQICKILRIWSIYWRNP